MTERKPTHETVPDFVERQILEAQQRGDFDGLRGHGRPLEGLGTPDDELWWVRRKLRDEHVTDLPPALQARRERDMALRAAAEATTEDGVRRVLEVANARIRQVNRTTVSGPPTATMPVDVEAFVTQWRRDHPPAQAPRVAAPAPPGPRWRRVVARIVRIVRR